MAQHKHIDRSNKPKSMVLLSLVLDRETDRQIQDLFERARQQEKHLSRGDFLRRVLVEALEEFTATMNEQERAQRLVVSPEETLITPRRKPRKR